MIMSDTLHPAPETTSDAVLSVRDLTVSFGSADYWKPVVRNISFDVGANETVAVVGESGSGKSVTALAIMRLLPKATSRINGQILLNGRDVLDLPLQAMQALRGDEAAMVFQEPMTSLNPVLTIGFQLAEALKWHRDLSNAEALAEAHRLLDRVRIPAAERRLAEYPHNLSGGMRQRVMIAMALACRPKLLIADEPTTALDVTIQAQILDLIRELQADGGMSVLFITHDMGVVAEIADRTVVMFRGDQVETEHTEAIFRQPAHPYTRALLASVPRLGSMRGTELPVPFPKVDMETGAIQEPEKPAAAPARYRPMVLDVQNLVTRFDIRSGLFNRISGRVHAVENVSFSIAEGETLALVGESGCGKSTTGRSIMRLTEPVSGSITVDGFDAKSVRGPDLRRMRRSIQMIFQDPFSSLNPRARIGSSIAEPFLEHGLGTRAEAIEKVAEILRRVGLGPDAIDRFPHQFSGGQRQRICIARALMLDPKLIVADESVSALDVSVKAQVVNLMMELQASLGVSFLFISHDMSVVERIAHRVAVMYLGEIVEIGSRTAIFENPQHPYTKRLLSAVPIPDPTLRRGPSAAAPLELKSPIRSIDYVPQKREFREISADHKVQVWGSEWETEA
jgi:peptide/nickel transport system ATP-binding protein